MSSAMSSVDLRARALIHVSLERVRQEALSEQGKFPFTCASPNGLTEAEKLGVLAEEFGEVAGHVCKHRIPNPTPQAFAAYETMHPTLAADYRAHLREELIQVAAVCVAWVEALDKEGV